MMLTRGCIVPLACLYFGFLGTVEAREAPKGIQIDPKKAVHAILGEARGEGYAGMYAVACAIRNRAVLPEFKRYGPFKGVYGLGANLSGVKPKTRSLALLAWNNSLLGYDVTLGATHWHNLKREGETYWTKKLQRTVEIGNHVFYKYRE